MEVKSDERSSKNIHPQSTSREVLDPKRFHDQGYFQKILKMGGPCERSEMASGTHIGREQEDHRWEVCTNA